MKLLEDNEELSKNVNGVSGKFLRQYIDKIERLEETKSELASDMKEVYAEAKGNGFDTKTIKKVIKIRKMDKNVRQEEETLLEVYMNALGMSD